MNWNVFLSNGEVFNSTNLFYPGATKSPWMIFIDLLNEKNYGILKSKYGEYSVEELKSFYFTSPHDEKPELVTVTNIQIIINGIIYNSLSNSKRSTFASNIKASHFWIFGRSDFEMVNNKCENYICFTYLVGDLRFYQWFDEDNGNSWAEVTGINDPRNIMISKHVFV